MGDSSQNNQHKADPSAQHAAYAISTWRRDHPKHARAFRDKCKKAFLMSGLENTPVEKANYISGHCGEITKRQGKRSSWGIQMEKANDLREVKAKLSTNQPQQQSMACAHCPAGTPKPCLQTLSKGTGVTCVCVLNLPRQASTVPCTLIGKEIQEMKCQRLSAVSCRKVEKREQKMTGLAYFLLL